MNGAEAIRRLRERRVDVAVTDLRLPNASGLDILRSARELGLHTRFVVVTGFANTLDTVNAMRLGASTLLEKPASNEQYYTKLRAPSRNLRL